MCPFPTPPLLENRSHYELDAARQCPFYIAARIRFLSRYFCFLMQVKDKAESASSLGTEEHLRSLLEPTLKETTFPLGTDVKVSRVSIEDFDECASEEYNDCSTFATCANTQV
jgi:hypothetical protein